MTVISNYDWNYISFLQSKLGMDLAGILPIVA